MVLLLVPQAVPKSTTIPHLVELSHWRVLRIAELRPFCRELRNKDVPVSQTTLPLPGLHFMPFSCGTTCDNSHRTGTSHEILRIRSRCDSASGLDHETLPINSPFAGASAETRGPASTTYDRSAVAAAETHHRRRAVNIDDAVRLFDASEEATERTALCGW